MKAKATKFNTSAGSITIVWTDKGITKVKLPNCSIDIDDVELIEAMQASKGAAPPKWVSEAVRKLTKCLEGEAQDFDDLPLDMHAVTDFNQRVYKELRRLPAGKVISYGDLATKIGHHGAARAVGRAMATNPFALIIPCHRVVRSDGTLGEYSAMNGVATKKKLLAQEGYRHGKK